MNELTKNFGVSFLKFHKPYLTGDESFYVNQAIQKNKLEGPGFFTKECEILLEKKFKTKKAILTPSATSALEMAIMLLKLEPNDEIILPSYAFPSCATAILHQKCIPVFVDVEKETLNVDYKKVQVAITKRTKAFLIIHYAGVISNNIKELKELAKKNNLVIIEDAAQAIHSSFLKDNAGNIGDFGIFSFHQTKNIFCGEGGSLLINKKNFIKKAYIIRDKGTNRYKVKNGNIKKYTWVDMGSSYLTNELTSSFLYAQLKHSSYIIKNRLETWSYLYDKFYLYGLQKYFSLPKLAKGNIPNGHFFWILLNKNIDRDDFINKARINGFEFMSHFQPLHSSKAGKKYCRQSGNMKNTNFVSKQIVRIPIHTYMDKDEIKNIIEYFKNYFMKNL